MKAICFAMIFISTFLCAKTIQQKKTQITYTPTVGSMPIFDEERNEVGKIGFISYIKESKENRPITFAFNGGPGSSSVWLHMGTFGPRRIKSPEENQSITPPYEIVDNFETILDLTDLVFIDPIATGLSTPVNEQTKPYLDVIKDYQSVGHFIRDYTCANKRWNSPKYIAGESYGALRACGLASYLHKDLGIFLNGIILVSSAIDYQTMIFDSDNKLPYLLYLPTYATSAWYHGKCNQGKTLEEVAELARDFIYETYLAKLFCKSCFTKDQTNAIYDEMSSLIGLPTPLIAKKQGKINDDIFLTEFFGDGHQTLGRMDTRSVGYYSNISQIGFREDPSVTSIDGSFTAAFHDYLGKELDCKDSYEILSLAVNSGWNYFSYNYWGYPNLMQGLREALIVNPSLKVFMGSGYYDLATPFAATEYCIDHLDLPESFNANIQLEYYEGGHMYYLNPTARVKFKGDLTRFYQGK